MFLQGEGRKGCLYKERDGKMSIKGGGQKKKTEAKIVYTRREERDVKIVYKWRMTERLSTNGEGLVNDDGAW